MAKIQILETELRVADVQTRMPFKYGIANLTATPYLFVRARCRVGPEIVWGVAADGMIPKWFTKNPKTTYRQDLPDMAEVVRSACELGVQAGEAGSVFEIWRKIYRGQEEAMGKRHPPLLWAWGVSLIERAMIDAFCKARPTTLGAAVRDGGLGIELGEIHGELAGRKAGGLLPGQPRRSMIARHTVGLGDYLTDGDIPAGERIDDGLPQSLEDCIRAYGLTYFKIKLCGDPGRDIPRLRQVARVIEGNCQGAYAFTLDGNEQFHELAPFIDLWKTLHGEPALKSFLSRLIFVEQPLHRDVALKEEVGHEMRAWRECPPTIIDESDGELNSFPTALRMGYRGTSHKNCKGVFKGIANACLVAKRNAGGEKLFISGEDLCNIGPVALLQDLAAAATLGIEHIERNGHHYVRGLSPFPQDLQRRMIEAHGDLYRWHERGFATVKIVNGTVDVGSVVDAPFGVRPELELERFALLEEFDFSKYV